MADTQDPAGNTSTALLSEEKASYLIVIAVIIFLIGMYFMPGDTRASRKAEREGKEMVQKFQIP